MTATNACLWFDGNAEEAAQLYVSLFPNSAIDEVVRTPGDYHAGTSGSVLAVRFNLSGVPYLGLNGGPQFKFTEAVSFQIDCADQAECLSARRRRSAPKATSPAPSRVREVGSGTMLLAAQWT